MCVGGRLFRSVDCVVGANCLAGTAFDAGVGIDLVDVAFGDCAYGAFGQTGAACYA